MKIKETYCKSLLNKSSLLDYCINPYVGCSNACVYCYARFMMKYTKHKEGWGSFVDVKVNAVDVLKKEIAKRKAGSIFISSVTDPYQAAEKKYELTRKILEALPKNFKPSILTKSSLVTRDIDVLKKFKGAEVGITITSLSSWKDFEPNASPAEERIEALKKIHDAGIKTYVFLGPVLPHITDKELGAIMKKVSFADNMWVDRLNIKCGNWPGIRKVILERHPDILEKFTEAVFESDNYYSNFKNEVKKLRKNITFCY